MSKFIAIMRCPKHPNFWALNIEEPDGCGTRITPGKCCGSWTTLHRWPIGRVDFNEIETAWLEAQEAPSPATAKQGER